MVFELKLCIPAYYYFLVARYSKRLSPSASINLYNNWNKKNFLNKCFLKVVVVADFFVCFFTALF